MRSRVLADSGMSTGGASMRNGLLGRFAGNWGSGLSLLSHTGGRCGRGLPSRSTCVYCAGVALAMPLAPGNSPYRLSKLRFSAYSTMMCCTLSRPACRAGCVVQAASRRANATASLRFMSVPPWCALCRRSAHDPFELHAIVGHVVIGPERHARVLVRAALELAVLVAQLARLER